MATVYIHGRRQDLSPAKVIGQGGEAHIYQLDPSTVLKLFKPPDDPDYAGNQAAQLGAAQRLREHQAKLPAFPQGLPPEVIAPRELAYSSARSHKVVGYTMRYLSGMEVLLSLSDRRYREQGGIDGNQVVAVLGALHRTVQTVHQAGVVIGDFNDLNVLFDPQGHVFLVDADSMQFGSFYCRTFTARFVDPLHCEPDRLELHQPHTTESDWYAFNTMLFQALLYVGPYGGIHRPKAGKRLQYDARVLRRLTVFDDSVQYPKPATPYDRLPDELLEHFLRVYTRDQRGVFPEQLLQGLRWTTCRNCNTVHARSRCPACTAPGAVKEAIVRRGAVTATRIFRTRGRILHAAFHGGKLRYLYHEDGTFRREGDQLLGPGQLDTGLRYRIKGEATLLGLRERLLVFTPSTAQPEVQNASAVHELTMFDANSDHHFWIDGRQLQRNGRLGPEHIGDVLPERTLFWVGSQFGFGFYQAGQLMRSFVFDAAGHGFNDQVPIPPFSGQLIDATCTFSDRLAWFMVSLQENGRLVNRCYVIDQRGRVLAEAQADQDDNSWLSVGIRGRFAAGGSLFASTDDGIVQVSFEHGVISVTQTYPDTEPFVDATTQLLPGPGGIYAVSPTDITLLTIR